MKKFFNTKNYVAPTLSYSYIDLEGFLCNSKVNMNIYVDEDENMEVEEFVIYDN